MKTIEYTGVRSPWYDTLGGSDLTWTTGMQAELKNDVADELLGYVTIFKFISESGSAVTLPNMQAAYDAGSAEGKVAFQASVSGYQTSIGTPCSVTGVLYERVLAKIRIPRARLTKNCRLLVHHTWLSVANGTANRLCIQLNEHDANPGDVRFYRIDASTSSQQYTAISEIQFQSSLYAQVSGQAYSSSGIGLTGGATPLLSTFDFANNDLELSFTGELLNISNSVTLLGASVEVINGA